MDRIKYLKVIDNGVHIDVAAISIRGTGDAAEIIKRNGFTNTGVEVFLMKLSNCVGYLSDEGWDKKTSSMSEAHSFIRSNFKKLRDGDVVNINAINDVIAKRKR